jgi:nucleoside-diphosphate-sugar epimerase
MSKGKVTVLGLNGHIGTATAKAFAAAGWDVTGMARTDKHRVPGVRFAAGDSDSVADMRRAIGESDVVVNALNLPYHAWDKGRLEGQMARVLEALGTSGKTMLFPGNIYNFCGKERVITPELQQEPQTPRGAIRVRVEQMFEAAAARGDLQLIVLRAGDFYGPDSSRDWFDLAMFREIGRGRVATMGAPGVGHSWAYLPDLSRAFEALAAVRTTLGAVERFHFAGHFATPEDMAAAIAKAAPAPVRIAPFPLWLLGLLGVVDPIMRETAKMAYLWRNPMELRDERLASILGPRFGTPFDAAVRATVMPFFGKASASPKTLELSGPQHV